MTGGAHFVQTAGDHVLWADANGVWSSTPDGNHVYAMRSLRADGAALYYDSTMGNVVAKVTLQ